MKKLFFAVAAMAAMLTSCSKDDGITEVTPQNSMVTFTVSAPELATRANEGQGLQAKNLKWVIYDLSEAEGQNQISGETTFPENSLTTTVEVSLVEGREYEAIFFAYADNSPYTFNATAQTMSIDASGLKANNEAYDAFFKYVEPFEIETEAYNVDVEMKRPFAQLNVATSDMQTDAGKMIDAATTGVKVEAYTTLNFKTGAVADKELITYALDQKMSGHIVAGQDSYDWLTMNYILVNERETVNVEFSFTDEKGNGSGTDVYTRNYTAVPVERNYRTNIVGTILTSTTNFNVEIVPGFVEPNIDWNVDGVTEVPVENGDLQTALNSLGTGEYNKPGTYIFKLTEDMTGVTRAAGTASIIVEQKEGYNIIIDGCGLKFDGTFNIYGGSRSSGTETLIFRNINFVHADGKIDFIWSDATDNPRRYPHNVTVENCTFTGNSNGAVVGMRFRQIYNANIVNCVSGEGMFSLAQISSSQKDLFIDNVTINNNKEGINLLSSLSKTIIKNSNISADVYGVRADGNCSDALTIENTAIAAEYPVVVRKMKNRMDVVFNGHNTLEAGQQYDVIFTNADSHTTLIEPTGEWSITGADNFSVYPREVAISTAEELKAFRDAVNAGNNNYKGKVVTLANNIDLAGAEWAPIGGSDKYKNNFAGTFDGMGYTVSNFTVNGEYAGFFGTISGGATIKNLTIDNATLSGPHYAGGIVAWAEAGATSLTIENCHVKNSTITLAAEKVNGEWDNGDKAGGIIGFSHVNQIIGCSVENTTITAYRDCGGIVGYAKNGVVKDNKILSGVNLIQDNSNNYKNYTTEADFNFGDIIGRRDGTPAESGNIGLVTKTGGVFNGWVKADGEYYVLNANGLAAINAMMMDKSAGKNVVVNLVDDIDFAGKTWTPVDSHADTAFTFKELNGNGHTISNLTINGQAMFTRFAGTGDVLIKDVTFDNAQVNSNGKINTSILTVHSYQNVTLDDVDVKNSSISGGYKVAPLIATVYNESASTIKATLKNCDVENVTVKATSYDFCTTGMVAFVHAGDNDQIEFENCMVKDVKLIAPNDSYKAHAAVYTTGSEALYNEVEGVTVVNVTFEAL